MSHKIWAALAMGATSGSIKALTNFRQLERQITGAPSALPTPAEVSDGVKHIFDDCEKQIPITPLRNGHMVNLRSVIELELHNYLTGEPTKNRLKCKDGTTRAATVPLFETKIFNQFTGEEESGELKRPWQNMWIFKITWDARLVAKGIHQVEMMVLLIPAGEEGQHYNQSCLRIRSVMVLDGKDTEDNCQANFPEALQQISDLAKHGVRYSKAKDTLLGQCAAAKDEDGNVRPVDPESGDLHAKIIPFLPSDMAAMNALEGHGGMQTRISTFALTAFATSSIVTCPSSSSRWKGKPR
jgi:hypothetical protein